MNEQNLDLPISKIASLFAMFESLMTLKVPLSYKDRKIKAQKKYNKYQAIPRALVASLKSKISKKLPIDWDAVQAAGEYELQYQMNRLYGLDREMTLYPLSETEFQNLFPRIYDEEHKDLRVGPFFLKGLSKSKGEYSPYINGKESGSLKRIKIAILDELRSQDPLPKNTRADIRKYKDLNHEYQTELRVERNVPDEVVKRKFKWTDKKIKNIKELAGIAQTDFDNISELLGTIDRELEKYLNSN